MSVRMITSSLNLVEIPSLCEICVCSRVILVLQALAMSWSSISSMMVFLYRAGMGYGAHILSNTSMGNLKLWMLTVCNCALKPCAWRKCFHARLLKEPCSISGHGDVNEWS